MAPKSNDKGAIIDDRKINNADISRVDSKSQGDDEVLQEILLKIRARRERMIHIANSRYRSSTSLSTYDGTSSPEATTPTRRQRLNASKSKQALLEQQQQQQQQQQKHQQCIRRSVGDFLSHLQRDQKKTIELEVTFGKNDNISSPVVNEEMINSVLGSKVEDEPKVSKQQRHVNLTRQNFLRKPRAFYSARTPVTPELPSSVTVNIPVKTIEHEPERFRFEVQQCESFPRVKKIPKPCPVVYDALLDQDDAAAADDDDDDLKSQDSEDTYVPDDLKQLFISACGTNFKSASCSPDPVTFDSPFLASSSCFVIPDFSFVSERFLKSNHTNQNNLLLLSETNNTMKQHEAEVTSIPLTAVKTLSVERDVPHAEDNEDAVVDGADDGDVAVAVAVAGAGAGAGATASESCIFPNSFISSLYPNLPGGDDVCGSLTTAELTSLSSTINSPYQSEKHNNKEVLNPHCETNPPKTLSPLIQFQKTCAQKIGIRTELDSSSEIRMPEENTSMVDTQGNLKLQDMQAETHTDGKTLLDCSLQSNPNFQSNTINSPKLLAQNEIHSKLPQDPECQRTEENATEVKSSHMKKVSVQKNQTTMTRTESVPQSIQRKEILSTTEKSSRHFLKPIIFKPKQVPLSPIKTVKDIKVDNTPNLKKSILYSERFRKFRSHFQKRRQHRNLPMESGEEERALTTQSSFFRKILEVNNNKKNSNETNKETAPLTFDGTDPFSLEVMLAQENNLGDGSSLNAQKDDKNENDSSTDDESYYHFSFQNDKNGFIEEGHEICPSDEEQSYVHKSKQKGTDPNQKDELISPQFLEKSHFDTMNLFELRCIPDFLYNFLFKDITQNSYSESKYIQTDTIKLLNNDSYTLDEDIPSLDDEDDGWSKEEYYGNHDDNENEPSLEETCNTRNDEDDDEAESIALSEGVDRVLEAATESGLFDMYADIDDMWLAKVVLKKFAKAQNIAVDDLIETVCDKLDAFDTTLFHNGSQRKDVTAVDLPNKNLPHIPGSVNESPYWSPKDFTRGNTQVSI
jgi:hypothetical protein